MNILIAFILGLIQGLAEFLPISSSGHLILIRAIFGLQGDYLLFDIALHFGTLLAVCVFFWRELVSLAKPPFRQTGFLAIATIPAVIVGFFLKDYIEPLFGTPKFLWIFFLITATLLVLTTQIIKRQKNVAHQVGIGVSILMGLSQGVAIIPGISRSGSTIAAGIASNVDRSVVAKFSFLMSIAIIVGSLLLALLEQSKSNVSVGYLLIGVATSFASGLLAIKTMMKLIQKANLNYFAGYLVVVSLISFFVYFL